jgi:hypothetical protein
MGERRALIEGIGEVTDADPEEAADFVFNRKPRQESKSSAPAPKAPKPVEAAPAQPPAPRAAAEASAPSPLTGVGRVPVGARVRTELAAALKRASLERQLHGIQPNSVQEILEDSLELWLLKHGHLK